MSIIKNWLKLRTYIQCDVLNLIMGLLVWWTIRWFRVSKETPLRQLARWLTLDTFLKSTAASLYWFRFHRNFVWGRRLTYDLWSFPSGVRWLGCRRMGVRCSLVVVAQLGWGTCVCALCTYIYIALPRLYSYESFWYAGVGRPCFLR